MEPLNPRFRLRCVERERTRERGRGGDNGEPVVSQNLCHSRTHGLKQLPFIRLVTPDRPGRAPPGTWAAAGQQGTGADDLAASARLALLLCDPSSWSRPSWLSWLEQREARGRRRVPGALERAQGAQCYFQHVRLGRAARGAGAIQGREAGLRVSSEELQSQRRWRGHRAALRRTVGATNPHAHRGRFWGCVLGNRTRQLVLPL